MVQFAVAVKDWLKKNLLCIPRLIPVGANIIKSITSSLVTSSQLYWFRIKLASYAVNILNISGFNALSIVSGLEAAVSLCMKRGL